MCEFCHSNMKGMAMNAAQHFRSGAGLPGIVQAGFPNALLPYCCPVCGRYLQEHEKNAPGAACTRSMCQADYNAVFAGNVSTSCKVCGGQLDQHKVVAQQQNPREVRNHIHEGNCLALWSLIHNVSYGSPEFVQLYANEMSREPQDVMDAYTAYQARQMYPDDVIDAQWHEVPRSRPQSQPVRALPNAQLMLEHQPVQTVEQMFGGGFGQAGRAGAHHVQGEPVKVHRVQRKRY